MEKPKRINVNEKIAKKVVDAYHHVEDGVVGAYRKVEDGFVDRFLAREGETVEQAKERLKGEAEPED